MFQKKLPHCTFPINSSLRYDSPGRDTGPIEKQSVPMRFDPAKRSKKAAMAPKRARLPCSCTLLTHQKDVHLIVQWLFSTHLGNLKKKVRFLISPISRLTSADVVLLQSKDKQVTEKFCDPWYNHDFQKLPLLFLVASCTFFKVRWCDLSALLIHIQQEHTRQQTVTFKYCIAKNFGLQSSLLAFLIHKDGATKDLITIWLGQATAVTSQC